MGTARRQEPILGSGRRRMARRAAGGDTPRQAACRRHLVRSLPVEDNAAEKVQHR